MMIAKLRIRRFVQRDMLQLGELLEKIGWSELYIDGQKKSINKLINDGDGDVYVATLDSVLAGYIQVQNYYWNQLSQIHGLVVTPALRRQGIAQELVQQIEIIVKNKGNRGVYVDTPVNNEAGRAFYTAIGYVEAYTMPEFYEARLDGVTYLKLFDSIKF